MQLASKGESVGSSSRGVDLGQENFLALGNSLSHSQAATFGRTRTNATIVCCSRTRHDQTYTIVETTVQASKQARGLRDYPARGGCAGRRRRGCPRSRS